MLIAMFLWIFLSISSYYDIVSVAKVNKLFNFR